jgi:hypothetical protein
MGSLYFDEHRRLQKEFDTVKLATLLDTKWVHDEIGQDEKAFIESRDFFFLDPRFLGLLDEIDVRPMLLDRKLLSATARQAREIASQGELDCVDDAALARSVRPAGGEILALGLQLQIDDPAELADRDLVDADHVASGKRMARMAGSAITPSSRTSARSLPALSFRSSFFSSSSKNAPSTPLATVATGAASSASCACSYAGSASCCVPPDISFLFKISLAGRTSPPNLGRSLVHARIEASVNAGPPVQMPAS